MNIATSEASLYQSSQDLDKPLIPLSVGAETLRAYVSNIIELLISQQLQGTVWIKLPQTKSWINQVKRLQIEGNVERIFLCSSQIKQPNLSLPDNSVAKTPIIHLKLNPTSTLQKESFLIVSAIDFCSLTLAQWQKSQIQIDASGKRLQQPYLQMVSSYCPSEIAPILLEVKQNLLPNANISQADFQLDARTVVRVDLLSKLILKQVEQNEILQAALNSVSRTSQIPEQSSTILGLQEDFLDNLVQELRSPITHMKTALSLLESKQIKGEQRQRYLQMVSDECERQNSLVSGLLGLLQLDTPTEAEYLRLDDIVPGIVSIYQPLAEEKEILLGYTIPANLLPISCPLPWFRQIIINLLNNSLQFTPPNGRVFVQAALKNDREHVEILVTDTGVGIPHQEINKIFDGFYRTKPATDEVKGAGLGLTLVKQLIQRCGGTISVSSKTGKGTTFKILMPAVPRELV